MSEVAPTLSSSCQQSRGMIDTRYDDGRMTRRRLPRPSLQRGRYPFNSVQDDYTYAYKCHTEIVWFVCTICSTIVRDENLVVAGGLRC